MSTIYIDRDGDEWKKNCNGCSSRNERKPPNNATYCDALREFLNEQRQFSQYYSQHPNSCPHFRPRCNY
jgi:hypothetical protein